MKQTLTYLQQELIKSGKKNIPKVPDKGSNSNASWQSSSSDHPEMISRVTKENDNHVSKKERKKKR